MISKKEAIEKWKEKFEIHASINDPFNYICWRSVSIGFFMAYGFSYDSSCVLHLELVKKELV